MRSTRIYLEIKIIRKQDGRTLEYLNKNLVLTLMQNKGQRCCHVSMKSTPSSSRAV